MLPKIKKNRIYRKLILGALFLCFVAVFYYSWLPNPKLEQETYLSSWIRDWSNKYYNLRTAVPFIAIGFLLEVLTSNKNPLGKRRNGLGLIIRNTFISSVGVCTAEAGQFFVKNRNPDLVDIFFGILGSLIGCFIYSLVFILLNLKNLQHAE